MEQTLKDELLLTNGHKVGIQTSTRQLKKGEKSTFISIDTGCFRIRIVQRLSLHDLMPENAKIGFSTTSETDDLTAVETLALSLEEAIKLAEQLNEKILEEESPDVNDKITG